MRSIVFGLVALTAPAPASAGPEGDTPPPAEASSSPQTPEPPAEPVPSPPDGQRVLDRVLPCGTRVLVARDDSLPVASVVLALEAGSEDDPAGLPGLHHALAYQLLMGNRSAAPGAIQALVQDAGGIAFLATGPAQIRFEALVPVTVLDELIVAEAQRFRAPTVTESLWKEALVSAKRDVPLRRTTPWNAAAVAHGAPGLAHRPRAVPDALRALDVTTIEAELARRARYEAATMVVVAPLPLEDTFAKVEAALADLPARERSIPERAGPPSAATVEQPKATGNTFVWAVPGEPSARLWADAWCEALSRQRRARDEPKPNRVRCAFDDDPRRPSLTIRIRTPGDPQALLEARLGRLAGNERLLRSPKRRLLQGLNTENATPLGLARRLAASPADEVSAGGVSSVERLTGVEGLRGAAPSVETLLPVDRAVRVVPPASPPEAKPSPAPTEGPT